MRGLFWQAAIVLAVAGWTWASPLKAAAPPRVADTPTPTSNAHEHGDWWCGEHGVPEEICSQCDPKVAAACKKKGDWCKEHDRADSQCFKCHPKLKEKYAALYRAKYGKEPPPTAEDKEEHEKKGK